MMETKPEYNGWIKGNNYKRRGRLLESKGIPDREPWYEADDGTRWSAYDVYFIPDESSNARDRVSHPDASA